MKGHCGFWTCANRIGLFLVILFVLCILWFYINPAERDLHMRLLNSAFLGWSGMNLTSFILGAIQSYLWAYIGVGIWHLVGCCHTGGSCEQK